MADVWPVYEGKQPTRGEPWASLSLEVAIALLDLQPQHFISDPSRTPRFGPRDQDLSIFGYKHIVVEVHPDEERLPDWKAGFYRSPVSPRDAFNLILRNALASVLGEANVLRVEHAYSTDSRGRNNFQITVVLTPNARQHITGDISLRAAGRLQSVLADLRVEGTPILQYATEDELAHNE